MLFSWICWQYNFITVTSYFLRLEVSHDLFIYRCAVFPLSRNSGCSGARGRDGQYSSNVGAWGWGHFCCYFLFLDFVHLSVGPGILHLFGRTTLLHHFALRTHAFVILSRPLSLSSRHKHWIRAFVFYFRVLHRTEEFNHVRERGEWMDDIWTWLHNGFTDIRAQLTLVLYMFHCGGLLHFAC